MPLIFDVEPKLITQLSDYQLTKLLKLLLELEADKFGIPASSISVADNITASDGGIDGKVEWENSPIKTDFFPYRLVGFQSKAKECFPSDCGKELIDKKTKLLKPMIEALFEEEGVYVFFTSYPVNEKGEIARKEAFHSKLKELNKTYADSARIEIYDAGKIATWCNKYIAAVIAVNGWLGRATIPGMLTWEEWGQYADNQRFTFVTNSKHLEFLEQLRLHFNESTPQVARIIGLPGMGKTRLAFEVFRPVENFTLSSQKVVYIDVEHGAIDLPGIINEWIRLGLSGIVIVDNCINSLHITLRKIVTKSHSKISLLTIDYNLDLDPATHIVNLEPHDDTIIRGMLEPLYKDRIRDLDRIVAFAQGFPQMVVLLADASLNQRAEMGNLTDDDLLKRLLWGSSPKDSDAYSFLMACSLFEQFGFKDEVEEEAIFISEKVAGLPYTTFYKYLKEYKKRGLIKFHGRYAQMIPKPLAIRLSSDWWANQPPSRTKQMILSSLPGQLTEALCNQVAKLDFLPEIKELTQNLCGCQGPFGQAEEMLSERGSRLFCSLVETNPIACVEALERVLGSLDCDTLRKIRGRVRRNIIWSLEKICFHRDSFVKGARLMLSLAVSENEKFSNNATGQFLQLFATYLSGTEAEPKERLKVIHIALLAADKNVIKLVIGALENALPKSSSGRWLGAENQGSGKALQDWQATTWEELYEYWDAALQILASLTKDSEEIALLAKAAIANNIRGLMRYNRFKILSDVMDSIIQRDGNYWPDALSEIRASLCYDKTDLSKDCIVSLQSWDVKLQPNTIRDQLKLFVTESLIEFDLNGEGKPLASCSHLDRLTELAEKCVMDPKALLENLDVLLTGHQDHSYEFGQILGEKVQNLYEIIDKGLDLLKVVPDKFRNPLFLISLFVQLRNSDPHLAFDILKKIESDEFLVIYYPRFLQNIRPTKLELDTFIELVKKNKCSIESAEPFTINKSLSHLTPHELSEFLSDIAQFDLRGPWIALEIFSSYRRTRKILSKDLKDTLLKLIKCLVITPKLISDGDLNTWKEEVKYLLEKKNDKHAVLISKQILDWIATAESFSIGYFLGPIISILFEYYSDVAWPLFSDKIEHSKEDYRFKLVNILKQSQDVDKTIYYILKLKEEYLLKWCRENTSFAPRFLAKIIPFVQERDCKGEIHELALILINVYGGDNEVLQAFEQNMGTFTWQGGLTNVYKIQEEALQNIENHSNDAVRIWVKSLLSYIKSRYTQEAIREEELDLGFL